MKQEDPEKHLNKVLIAVAIVVICASINIGIQIGKYL